MATYSGFNWTQKQFAVFQDNRPAPLMADAEHCNPGPMYSKIGYDINSALCPLPQGAQFTGWSDVAIGQVVRLPPQWSGIGTAGNQAGVPGLGSNEEPVFSQIPTVLPTGGIGYVPALAKFGVRTRSHMQTQESLGQAAFGGGLGFVEAIAINVGVSVLSGLVTSAIMGLAERGRK